MGHTALAPEGREERYQAGPKGRSLEVGARRAPRLLVHIYGQQCCLAHFLPNWKLPLENQATCPVIWTKIDSVLEKFTGFLAMC